jgi:uncharacterized protein YbbC (DUF1343 family)
MLFLLAFCALAGTAHGAPLPRPTLADTLPPAEARTPSVSETSPETFKLGIEVLSGEGFGILKGKRVGLLTHAAAVDRHGESTIEILRNAPAVHLVALFAPEHGLDSRTLAEKSVADAMDAPSGLPIRSVYGATRKPTPKMLADIDVMVVDLQDIGVRSYTYASAMKYVMEACFEKHIPVVVLDRPNPLGGLKVDGPVLNPKWRSYVGALEVPYIHGLTLGELARVAQDELKPLRGQLTVVPMQGWRRYMLWPDTGLPWHATSPSIPNAAAAFGYACTGLGAQLGGFRHGYGTEYPFRFLSHPKIPTAELLRSLQAAQIPGLRFVLTKEKKGNEGIYVLVSDWNQAGAIELGLTMLRLAQTAQGPEIFAHVRQSEGDLFCKHWGRDEPLLTLGKTPLNAKGLAQHWRDEAQRWQGDIGMKYWLYR